MVMISSPHPFSTRRPFFGQLNRDTITRRMKLILSVVLSISFITLTVCSDIRDLRAEPPPSIRADISPTSGQIDDLFLFTITVDGTQQRATPQIKTGGDFNLKFLGPKTSVSVINGQVRTQQSFVYQLIPKRSGTLYTPEAQVMLEQRLLSAQPIAVAISDTSKTVSDPVGSEQLFLRQTAYPQTAFVGQQIAHSVTLYARVPVQDFQMDHEATDGFWQETISNNDTSQKIIKGKEYSTLGMNTALFPLRSGELTIAPRRAKTKKIVQGPSPWDSLMDPFNQDLFDSLLRPRQFQEINLQTDPLQVSIKPLPLLPIELSKLSKNTPLVGATSLTTNASFAPIATGESKTISIVVTSEGNLNLLKGLSLTAPAGVKLYDGPPTIKRKVQGDKLITEKTFTFTAIPLSPGTIRISGAAITYFDPDTATYRLTAAPETTILVTGAPLSGSATTDPRDSSAIGLKPPPTIAPPIFGPDLEYRDKSLLTKTLELVSIQLALLIFSAALAFCGLIAGLLYTRRSLQSRHSFISRLAAVRDLAGMELFIREQLSERIPGVNASSTWDELRASVRAHIADPALRLSVISLLDEIELQRYGKGEPVPVSTFKDRAATLLRSWQA